MEFYVGDRLHRLTRIESHVVVANVFYHGFKEPVAQIDWGDGNYWEVAPSMPGEMPPRSTARSRDWGATGRASGVGYGVRVAAVSTPSLDAQGALEAEVRLSGRGWSDVTIESPELNRDVSGFRELRVHVFGPEGAPPDLKAQLFAKSGSTWQWIDAGWQPLSQKQWTKLRLPVEKIDDRTRVRTVGAKIGGNSPFIGSVFIDLAELASNAVVPAPQIAVIISDITENTRIVGRISGLSAEKVNQYKVLVYGTSIRTSVAARGCPLPVSTATARGKLGPSSGSFLPISSRRWSSATTIPHLRRSRT